MLPGMSQHWLFPSSSFVTLAESVDVADRLVQPWERFLDGNRFLFPSGYANDRKAGRNWPVITTEQDLRTARAFCRLIADTNPLVIAFLDHVTNFVVGSGFKWKVGLKGVSGSQDEKDPAARACQRFLDDFCALNGWGDGGEVVVGDDLDTDDSPQTELQGELWRSAMRDGESFLRLYRGDAGTNGVPRIRKVNPECVTCPPGGDQHGDWSWGILTDAEDRQRRLRYNLVSPDQIGVNGEFVPAGRMLHLKLNVDADVKRGLSDFWPLQDEVQYLQKLWKNMGQVSALLAAIAYIRQHAPGVTGGQIRGMLDRSQSGVSDYRANFDPHPGTDRYSTFTTHAAGQVIDITNQMQYEPPPIQAGAAGFIQVEQAILRLVGLRWGCPEYFSGDSSNANFASTLVAGGPFERSAQRRQQTYKLFQQNLAARVLLLGVESGRLTRDQVHRVSVKVTTPAVAIANKSEDTQRRSTLYQAGVLSKRTWAAEEGLDPDTELATRKQEDAEAQAQQQPPGGGDMPPGDGAPVPTDQPPQGQPDAGGGDPLADLFAESAGVLDADLARLSEAVTQLVQKTITDKLGRKSKRMVRADQDAPAQRQPGAPEAGGDHSPVAFDEAATTAHVASLPGLSDSDRTGLVGAVKGIFAAGRKAVAVAKAVASTVYEEAKLWTTRLTAAGITYEDALNDLKEMSNPLQATGARGIDHVAAATGIPSASWIGLTLVPKIATFALLKAKSMLAGKKQTESLLWEADDRETVLAEFREAMRQAILRGLGVGEGEPADLFAESVASEVPPELLAAILVAYNRGDMEAVGDLMDLADDPEALAELIDGTTSESVRTVQERMASRPGWTWNDQSKRWTKDEKKPRPERKTAPGQSPKEQLQARKQAAEPARQAARAAWGEAVSKGVTADQLPELAGHLQALTRDELREVARGLQKRVGGLKREVVDRLLSHVGAQPTTQGSGKEEPKTEPAKAADKQPWEMTKGEWDAEYEKGRPSSSGSHGVTAASRIGKSDKGARDAIRDHLDKQNRLKMGLGDVDAVTGEPWDEKKHGGEGLRVGARHHDVIAAALKAGKPVSAEVLADYPDLAAAHPEAAKFTGVAANGVRYVNGVPQKGEEEPAKGSEPKADSGLPEKAGPVVDDIRKAIAGAKGVRDRLLTLTGDDLQAATAQAFRDIDGLLDRLDAANLSKQEWGDLARELAGVREKTPRAARLAIRGKLSAYLRGLGGQMA